MTSDVIDLKLFSELLNHINSELIFIRGALKSHSELLDSNHRMCELLYQEVFKSDSYKSDFLTH